MDRELRKHAKIVIFYARCSNIVLPVIISGLL
jgi:hypothetical protein